MAGQTPAGGGKTQRAGSREQQVDSATKKLLAANGLYTRGLYKLAADEYEGFLKDYASHAQATAARYALAVCRYRLKEFGPAVEQLRAVLSDAKFEQRDEALAVLGHCELSQSHFDQAITAFDDLLAKYGSSKHAEMATLSRAQALYLAKKYPQAAAGCEDYLSRCSSGRVAVADAMYFLALSQRAQDKNGAAVATASQLVEKFPESAHRTDALLLEGQGFESLDKFDQAITAYEQMLASAPEPRKPDTALQPGHCILQSRQIRPGGHKHLLNRCIETALRIAPTSSRQTLQLGMAHPDWLGANRARRGKRLLQSAAMTPSAPPEAQYGLAEVRHRREAFRAGDYSSRSADFRQPRGREHRANPAPIVRSARWNCHQFQPAADELKALRDQYANSPQAQEAIYRQAFCLHKLTKYDQSHALCAEVEKLKSSPFAQANTELDAENLFLMAQVCGKPGIMRHRASSPLKAKEPARKLRFTFRQGQCDYFAGDYAKAAATLAPVASDPSIASDADLRQAPLLLGDALLQQGKFTDAADPLEKYAAMPQADRPQAQYKLGIARLRANDAVGGQALLPRPPKVLPIRSGSSAPGSNAGSLN